MLSTTAALLATAKEVAQGEFRPNVVVAISRFGTGYTLDTAIQSVIDKVGSIEGVAELGRDRPEVLGRAGFRIEFSYPDARAGTLIQAVRLALVSNGPALDLVQVTATATAAQAMEIWPEIRAIQASATLS
ncbi:hypothetical protein ASF79_15080 [Agreia sp. Leaf335]|uniref:hypothetical protein n=1 Tax=Agreia sp. Leaf335 TaxID=1736340 RepID=UPI0006F379E6|nr:hypothetical protein [Agreia sp. Leaf335]KQR19012.1 hypothetical protein ASF79_15080 [Agreia sp. Leaf335]